MIQIFGTKKSSDTRKAERFFKERRIPYQLIDLAEKPMSRGELESVSQAIPIENLIDRESKEYARLNLKYMDFDVKEMLLEHPLLFVAPVIRLGKEASCGYDPQAWKRLAENR